MKSVEFLNYCQRSVPLIPSSLLTDSHGPLGSKPERCLEVPIMNLYFQILVSKVGKERERNWQCLSTPPSSLQQISIMGKGH